MRSFIVFVAMFVVCAQTSALTVYNQPHNFSGTLYQSSWIDPDGSDSDQYVWDNFTLGSSRAITEVRWRGGFIYGGAYGGPVLDFRVAIYPSIAGGSEPDVAHPPLVQYQTNGNANQTAAGTFGGVGMYDYRFTLPAAFQATGGTRYWLHIYAYQHGIPEWGFAAGSGGNGSHFRRLSEYMYQMVPGDTAFSLIASDAPTYTISASALPSGAGTIMGAGQYPEGSTASLVATPNAGFGFVDWTESNVQVSTSPTYTFTVNGDRTLVANFTTACTITTSPSPVYAGFTTGDGVYNTGSSVTVQATPSAGYVFTDWTEFGVRVSTSSGYTFAAAGDRSLVANFVTSEPSILFDFDNAPLHTSLPIDLTVGGLTAHLAATGQGFSIQRADTMGFTPFGFAGNCLYPNSVFPADLNVSFSAALRGFSILYSPQELGCDTSATMRVTAYLNGVLVGTAMATAPVPGTWPTGTLAFSSTQDFNSVVVHYEARPPTCQDWGPIFLADNMVVTPSACTSAGVVQHPGAASACYAGTGVLSVIGDGTAPLSYQWEREFGPGNFVPLADGPTGRGSIVSGAATPVVTIDNVSAADMGQYRCVIANACGSAASSPALLGVCTPDFNCLDGVNSQDFFDFLNAFFALSPASDINRDGLVNSQDFFDFLNAFFVGCP